MSLGRHSKTGRWIDQGTSAAQWIPLNKATVPAKMWLRYAFRGLYSWTLGCPDVTLHPHSGELFFCLYLEWDLIYRITLQLTGYLKVSKVRQVMADLALSQVSSKRVENLTLSEKRRLAIGVQLVRDPVMLLLDEPTQGLDPLSAYLLISILSNTAKKSGCGILLSLEKPRSDVFPFLDR